MSRCSVIVALRTLPWTAISISVSRQPWISFSSSRSAPAASLVHQCRRVDLSRLHASSCVSWRTMLLVRDRAKRRRHPTRRLAESPMVLAQLQQHDPCPSRLCTTFY